MSGAESDVIFAKPLTAEVFAPFGDVLECAEKPDKIINQGMCGRHHDLARLDFSSETGGRAGISLFDAIPRTLPYSFDLVERHPEGSQAFIPMSMASFLVIVAADNQGTPDRPEAFITAPGQAINFHRNTWHGVLTPLDSPGLFAVVDRIGSTPNLEEYTYKTQYVVKPTA